MRDISQVGTIGIMAGNGRLPYELASILKQKGFSVFVIGIEGEADDTIRPFPHEFLEWGKLGRLFKLLSVHNVTHVLFAGGVLRRPEIRLSKLDWGALRTLPQIMAFMLGGDNTVLTGTIALFEQRGFKVIGIPDIAEELLIQPGANTVHKATKADLRRLDHGLEVTKAIGRFDIGQGAVVIGKRAVALEGIEGTDQMLDRVSRLRREGRLPAKRGGVLVKTLKPGQDDRADLPTIGPLTIRSIADAGLSGVGVEAMRTIMLSRDETLELANRLRVFVHGLEPDEGSGDAGGSSQ